MYNPISILGVLRFIVPGTAVFVWNVVRSFRRGEPAGPNPWDADTLEWAVTSPPREHGWTVLAIVHSRHPLWDQDDPASRDPQTERFVRALASGRCGGAPLSSSAPPTPVRKRCSASPGRRCGHS